MGRERKLRRDEVEEGDKIVVSLDDLDEEQHGTVSDVSVHQNHSELVSQLDVDVGGNQMLRLNLYKSNNPNRCEARVFEDDRLKSSGNPASFELV